MNVNDFNIPIPDGDMLETIFNRQRELMNKYHEIETKNLGHDVPHSSDEYGPYCGALNVDDRMSQLRMKDFAWRVTEELTEATLALGEKDRTHYDEELIDALHFSVELLILCGFRAKDFRLKTGEDILEHMFDDLAPSGMPMNNLQVYLVIEKLGEACNRLKLKAWKTTAMLTDKAAFRASVREFFEAFIVLLLSSGFNARSTTAMYLNKHAVNQFRQASAY